MALIINSGTTFRLSSVPFSSLVPSGWLQTQEYEQFLDYLGQSFNDAHENTNAVLDFFDLNKCPDQFLKIIAYNMGMEIPLDASLSSYARKLLQSAMTVYKTKGTFDVTNTSVKGIGLWIKAATGYDITIEHLPILNPYLFVSQFNYRCARTLEESGSDNSVFKAVHYYEKGLDGVPRVMYQHELTHYATEPERVLSVFGMSDSGGASRIVYLFDYTTGQDIEGSDVAGITIPDELDHQYATFVYNNYLYLLFGLDGSNNPVSKIARFNLQINYNKSAADQKAAWEISDVVLPAGVTEITITSACPCSSFRNRIHFMALVDGVTSLCSFNTLTYETEIIDIGHEPTSTCFSSTKLYSIQDSTIYCYDLFRDVLSEITQIPTRYSGLTISGMCVYGSTLILATLDDNKIIRYDIMYDTFIDVTLTGLEPTAYSTTNYVAVGNGYMCYQRLVTNTVELYTVLLSDITGAVDNESIPSSIHATYVTIDPISHVFPAFVTGGAAVYPSTLIINVDSEGEFKTDRSTYGKKMNLIKTYISRYIQAGIKAIINDDN